MKLIEAIRVLKTEYGVPSQSDDSLLADVVKKTQSEDLKRINDGNSALIRKSLVKVPALDGAVTLRPADVLLHLARSIPQQPFMGPFIRMANWGFLKYIGLFDEQIDDNGVQKLCLAPISERYRGNMRRILSEELGVGFGQAVAEQWIRSRYPLASGIMFADVDTILDDGSVPGLAHRGERRPDYIGRFSPTGAGGAIRHVAVECKGGSGSTDVHGQLARASSQLFTLEIEGDKLPGLAVANVSTSTGVEIYALDPLGDEPELRHSEFEPGINFFERLRDEQAVVYDMEKQPFLSAVSSQALASLAEFAGDFRTAERWMPMNRPLEQAPLRTTVQTAVGEFDGIETSFADEADGGFLTVFRGVEVDVLEALASLDYERITSTQAQFTERQNARQTSVEDEGDDRSVVSTLSDGSCLIVKRNKIPHDWMKAAASGYTTEYRPSMINISN